MQHILAQFGGSPPQPVSEPVHYSSAQYLGAYLTIAVVLVLFIVVLAALDKRMATPKVIISALLLSMFCTPVAIIYLFVTYKNLKANS